MTYIKIGKIVNTHGIKGEIRILSNFKYIDRALKMNNTIFIGNKKEAATINSYRIHKNFHMITINNLQNINDVLKYKGLNIYTKRQLLNLGDKEYLDEDLIGLKVYMNNIYRGEIKDIRYEKYQNKFIVNNDETNFLVPFVYDIIDDINLEKGSIIFQNIEGLFNK